jgi:hypothetical protein
MIAWTCLLHLCSSSRPSAQSGVKDAATPLTSDVESNLSAATTQARSMATAAPLAAYPEALPQAAPHTSSSSKRLGFSLRRCCNGCGRVAKAWLEIMFGVTLPYGRSKIYMFFQVSMYSCL